MIFNDRDGLVARVGKNKKIKNVRNRHRVNYCSSGETDPEMNARLPVELSFTFPMIVFYATYPPKVIIQSCPGDAIFIKGTQ